MKKLVVIISLTLFSIGLIFIFRNQLTVNSELVDNGPTKVDLIYDPNIELESSLIELEVVLREINSTDGFIEEECGIISNSIIDVLKKLKLTNHQLEYVKNPELVNAVNQSLINIEIDLVKLLIKQNQIYCAELVKINNKKRE